MDGLWSAIVFVDGVYHVSQNLRKGLVDMLRKLNAKRFGV